MRVLKLTIALAGMLGGLQYLVVYYHSVQFHEFVRQEASKVPEKSQLQRILLSKAREYSLSVTEQDIDIRMIGTVLRVAVDYTAPVNLLVFRPALKFRAIAAGLAPQ
jgi:hypothetical protein